METGGKSSPPATTVVVVAATVVVDVGAAIVDDVAGGSVVVDAGAAVVDDAAGGAVVDAGTAVVDDAAGGAVVVGAAIVDDVAGGAVIVVTTGGGSTLNPTDPRSVNSFPHNAEPLPTQAQTTYPPAATAGTLNVPDRPPLALTPHGAMTFVFFGGGTAEVVKWMLQEMLPPVGVKPNPLTVTDWLGTPTVGFTLIDPAAAAAPVGRLIAAASRATAMKIEKLRCL